VPTFSADVVVRREEYRPKSKYEVAEEPRLRVVEDLDPLQCVEMNVQRDLGTQLVWQQAKDAVLFRGPLARP